MPIGNFAGSTLGRKENSVKPLAGGTPMFSHGYIDKDDTTAKTLFTLPHGAVIVNFIVNVEVAFNAGDTNVMDIGKGATGNAIKNDLAVGSTGQTVTGWTVTELNTPLEEETAYTATYVPGGTAATTGKAHITAIWYQS